MEKINCDTIETCVIAPSPSDFLWVLIIWDKPDVHSCIYLQCVDLMSCYLRPLKG